MSHKIHERKTYNKRTASYRCPYQKHAGNVLFVWVQAFFSLWNHRWNALCYADRGSGHHLMFGLSMLVPFPSISGTIHLTQDASTQCLLEYYWRQDFSQICCGLEVFLTLNLSQNRWKLSAEKMGTNQQNFVSLAIEQNIVNSKITCKSGLLQSLIVRRYPQNGKYSFHHSW